MSRLVVWGAGELGSRVATAWVAGGEAALGLTRTPARHRELKAAGVGARTGSAVGELRVGDALLIALPGSHAQADAVSRLAPGPPPARAVPISTTGYYGEASGPVNEDTPPGPGERAAAAAIAEAAFRAWAGPAGVVLRLGGLYSQGRGPFAALARRGAAPFGPPDRSLALIHYDDAATAAFAALRHPAPAPTYLGVSPPCPSRRDFYQAASVILNLEDPMFDAPTGRPLAEHDVTRLRRDLLPQPAWPRWQAALVP